MKKLSKDFKKLDSALFAVGTKIEILDKLRWPLSIRNKFIRNWNKGQPQLPKIKYPKHSLKEKRKTLTSIVKACNNSDPLSQMLKETAESFHDSLLMIEAIGTKRFCELSLKLYGSPNDTFEDSQITTHRAAQQIIRRVSKFNLENIIPQEEYCIMPEYVAEQIRKRVKQNLKDANIEVKVDPTLISKASAGPNRIRVRSGTCFSEQDINQLIEHELFVHTLTLQNGRAQVFKTLGISSPRTACAQEGLAAFAEFITNSMDIIRLKRISCRAHGIKMGLEGADFIEVFRFFLEQGGQTELESFYSTARIFRGGDVKGGIVFTKDVVYLKGFIQVHRFFLRALQGQNFLYPHYFFSGRMCTSDVEKLEPYFDSGLLKLPAYEPDWIKNRATLLAYLLSSSVMSNLGLNKVQKSKPKSEAKILSPVAEQVWPLL